MGARLVNLDLKSGKVAVGGDGNAPISWTARKDIARYLAHVLVHTPATRLQNQILRLEGDRVVRFPPFLVKTVTK